MEVASSEGRSLSGFQEDQRVVGGPVQGSRHALTQEGQQVAHRSDDLRRAAQRVGILDPLGHGVHQAAALHQIEQVGGRNRLPGLTIGPVQARVEGRSDSAHGFQAERGGDFSRPDQSIGIVHPQRGGGQHHGRAVGQRQALLGFQHQARDAGPAHGLFGGEQLTLVPGGASI